MLSPILFNTGVAECLDVQTVNHDNNYNVTVLLYNFRVVYIGPYTSLHTLPDELATTEAR